MEWLVDLMDVSGGDGDKLRCRVGVLVPVEFEERALPVLKSEIEVLSLDPSIILNAV